MRVIEVKNCNDCPYFKDCYEFVNTFAGAERGRLVAKDIDGFPVYCPLRKQK
jgi:hypothetical protein